ncbi:MAG: AI-2E family transporter [Nitriliruptor sp.]|nr:MAG: AI-2E family transporter [Nitriliruptor sp.]
MTDGHERHPPPQQEVEGRAATEATAPVSDGQARLWRAGRTGWALLAGAGVVAVAAYVASMLTLLIIPLLLALFPATLLVPVAKWLKDKGVPAAAAAALSLLVGILAIGAVLGAMVPLVAAELPDLAESAGEGIRQVQQQIEDLTGVGIGGMAELLDQASELLGETGELAGQALEAAFVAFETVASLLLMFVVLFFYLKDGRRLAEGLANTTPPRVRPHVHEVMQRAWATLGTYFRGQLLVGLINATLIGIALLLLGIPLAVPLAVLVFFGGLFPVVGALIAGALAVLVAAADAGLVMALVVAVIVVIIEQLESNVFEPLIHGHAIALHPLVILLSITAGALLLGIFGAFIAVPVAAITARVLDYFRGDPEAEESDGGGEEAPEAT